MKDLEKQIEITLQAELEAVDVQTAARLQNARKIALSQQNSITSSWLTIFKWPVAMGASVAMAGLLMFVFLPFSSMQKSPVSLIEDFELLNAQAEVDLYTHLDFYQWMANSNIELSSFNKSLL